MKQTIIKVILLLPFLLFPANEKVEIEDPIELTIHKLRIEHLETQMKRAGQNIEFNLFLEKNKNENWKKWN